jgi:hypothetical protein
MVLMVDTSLGTVCIDCEHDCASMSWLSLCMADGGHVKLYE